MSGTATIAWESAANLPYDPASIAFFNAANITNSTQKSAVDTLVTSLKSNGLWNYANAIYPIVGGNATAHSYNLRNPSLYQLTYNGTAATNSSTGMKGDGSTSYADTGLNPTNIYNGNGFASLGIYLRTTQLAATVSAIGAISGATNYFQIYAYFSGNFFGQVDSSDISQAVSNTDSTGWFFASRIGATNSYLQQRAVQTTGFSGAMGLVNNNIYMMAQNNLGSAGFFTSNEIAFAWIGGGLTTSQGSTLYTIIQTYQTSLSRNV